MGIPTKKEDKEGNVQKNDGAGDEYDKSIND